MGETEWYFFCRRGRKYRNSVRPNRVTGSGFWKATGIDRPIYSGAGSVCIGLKKSLVYYRGSAAKGTKTEWMMHEFRLPAPSSRTRIDHTKNINRMDDKSISQEAVSNNKVACALLTLRGVWINIYTFNTKPSNNNRDKSY